MEVTTTNKIFFYLTKKWLYFLNFLLLLFLVIIISNRIAANLGEKILSAWPILIIIFGFITLLTINVLYLRTRIIKIDENSGSLSIFRPNQANAESYKQSDLKGFYISVSSHRSTQNVSLIIVTKNGSEISIDTSYSKRLEIINGLEKYSHLLEINKPFDAPPGPFDPSMSYNRRVLSDNLKFIKSSKELMGKNKESIIKFSLILIILIIALIYGIFYFAQKYFPQLNIN